MEVQFATAELHAKAIAAVHAPVDRARAVYRGMVLVGHRRSIQAGHMFWALPGGQFADGVALKASDPMFQVMRTPTEAALIEQQGVLRELMQ